jgi:hypothetical protein
MTSLGAEASVHTNKHIGGAEVFSCLSEIKALINSKRQAAGHALQGIRLSTSAPFGASVKTFVRYSNGTSPFSLAETIRL